MVVVLVHSNMKGKLLQSTLVKVLKIIHSFQQTSKSAFFYRLFMIIHEGQVHVYYCVALPLLLAALSAFRTSANQFLVGLGLGLGSRHTHNS